MRPTWRLALCVLAWAVPGVATADFSGKVIAVNDGDTLTVLVGRTQVRVRLAGIDAPERAQPFGAAARRALADRVAGRVAYIEERGRDGFGRVLARVLVDGVDVNAEQVRSGHAWVFRRFGADARLLALEAEAKAARRGLWRDPQAVPPWQWRERRMPAPRDATALDEWTMA